MSETILNVAGVDMTLLENTATFPQNARLGCQGVRGAYSEQAARKMFPHARTMFFRTFEGVIEAVRSGMVDYGILPIENNSYGSVRAVYHLLKRYKDVYIIRGERLLIRHHLLGKPGTTLEGITSIRSHEQALGQCSRFVKKMESQASIVPVLNTAIAARYVAETEDMGAAAIASPEAAETYGLVTLKEHVSDSDNNYTRFVCITREPVIYPGANKISMILSVEHKPGALFEVLRAFAELGINVTKLESSPVVGRDFEFLFYIDAEASVVDERVREMILKLKEECPVFIFLGNYAEG